MEKIKTILRAQWDSRKQMWKIVKKTENGAGGWARFGAGWHFGKDDAEVMIDRMVKDFPEQYGKE
jgi:hypothetical protein